MEQELALAVGPLVAALGGVSAPVQFKIQFSIPGGQAVSRFSLQAAEEITHVGLTHTGRGRESFHLPDVLQHLPVGTAAAVAVADDHQQFLL